MHGSLELTAGAAPLELEVTVTAASPGLKSAELALSPTVRVPLTANVLATGPCELSVAPPRLDFGLLSQVTELAVTVTHAGPDVCVLNEVGFGAGSDAVFSLPDGQVPLELLPGSRW